MNKYERQNAILRVLKLRRFDTVYNLSIEFGVSEKTIRRDIETLSLSEPIYTKPGRFGGGIYILTYREWDKDEETCVCCGSTAQVFLHCHIRHIIPRRIIYLFCDQIITDMIIEKAVMLYHEGIKRFKESG